MVRVCPEPEEERKLATRSLLRPVAMASLQFLPRFSTHSAKTVISIHSRSFRALPGLTATHGNPRRQVSRVGCTPFVLHRDTVHDPNFRKSFPGEVWHQHSLFAGRLGSKKLQPIQSTSARSFASKPAPPSAGGGRAGSTQDGSLTIENLLKKHNIIRSARVCNEQENE